MCNIEKHLIEFPKETRMRDGCRNNCKKCRDSSRTDRKGRNKKTYNAHMRKYRKNRILSQKQRDQATSSLLKSRYGITLEEYRQRLEAQGGHCFLCPKKSDGGRRLSVDHNHATGKIRGILCDGCNRTIAILDNPDLFSKAIAYLDQ